MWNKPAGADFGQYADHQAAPMRPCPAQLLVLSTFASPRFPRGSVPQRHHRLVAVQRGEQPFQVLDLRHVVDRDIGIVRI